MCCTADDFSPTEAEQLKIVHKYVAIGSANAGQKKYHNNMILNVEAIRIALAHSASQP